MSQSNETPKPITVVNPIDVPEVVVKQSLVKRGVHFVQSHKKAAIAVAGLTALVVVSAIVGKKTDLIDDSEHNAELAVVKDLESNDQDTTVA